MLKRILFLVLLSFVLMGQAKFAPFQAAAPSGFVNVNANSAVGINLGLAPGTNDENAFLNQFKNMTGWQPYIESFGTGDGGYTGETWYLYKTTLDSNGYPTTLNPSTQSTFDATISDGAGGSGTIINVTLLRTGPGPWNGGLFAGTGVTGTPFMIVPRPNAKFAATFNGTTSMTVTSFDNGCTTTACGEFITPGMLLSIPTLGTAHVVHCPTADTLANCQNTGVYTLDTSEPAGSVSIITSQQVEGTTGFYISGTAFNLGSRTFTESHQFDSLRAEATIGGCEISCYPAGNSSWELVYDTTDTSASPSNFSYHIQHNLSLASHNCIAGTCKDVLNVLTPGWKLGLTTLDPAKPISNIRMCLLGVASTTACENGTEYFNPDWIAQMKQFRTVRTMDWNTTNGNTNLTWAGRTPLSWVTWQDASAATDNYTGGGEFGFGCGDSTCSLGYHGDVPVEVEVALANELHSNLWFNIPCNADATYLSNSASYVLANLNSNLKVYVEVCNEWWNSGALIGGALVPTNYSLMATAGYNLTSGSCGVGVAFGCRESQYVTQIAAASAAWRSVWTGGNASRLKIILGGQYTLSNGTGSQNALELSNTSTAWSGTLSTHVDAFAVAPYWPCCIALYPPRSWSADSDDGTGKLYTDFSSGSLKPSAPTTGNCGNGAGFSCNPVDNAHFTVSSGNTGWPGSTATYAQTGLQNDMCISFITTNNSTGSPPQLNVDSGGAFNLSGSLTANHLVFTCYQNGIWTIQRDEPLGNCGNGLYTTCAGSDSSHFLLTTGESLADPPQNGHCIIYKSTISPGATPNLLKTDGGTYYKVVFQGNDVQLGAGTATLCFTNADTNGAVSPAVWEVIGLWNPCGPDFLCTVPQVAQDLYMAQNAGTAVALYGYEGGQSLLDPLTTIGRNMVVDFVKSVQFGTLYQQYLTNLHHAGMIEEQLYEDPRRWLNGIGNYNNFWGFNPGTYTYTNNVTSVIQRQLGIYSWINSNPCWWSGCTIH